MTPRSQDLHLSLTLLQNRPTSYMAQRVDTLPHDMRARVKAYIADRQKEAAAAGGGAATGEATTTGKKITVPIMDEGGGGGRVIHHIILNWQLDLI